MGRKTKKTLRVRAGINKNKAKSYREKFMKSGSLIITKEKKKIKIKDHCFPHRYLAFPTRLKRPSYPHVVTLVKIHLTMYERIWFWALQ